MAKVPNKVVKVTPQTEFHSYLQMVKNAPGTKMFTNFYVLNGDEREIDINNGDLGCALFVSSVLTIFKKIGSFHNTVYSTVLDMERVGWVRVEKAQPGDVLVWADAVSDDNDAHSHIGFYIGNDRAVSTSTAQHMVVEHDVNNHDNWRKVDYIYHLPAWSIGTEFTPAEPNATL